MHSISVLLRSRGIDIPGKKGKEAKLGLRLLNGVTGFAKPNTMTALMGSSGAGKTTLLDVLAGRKNVGKIGGVRNRRGCDGIEMGSRRVVNIYLLHIIAHNCTQ